MHFETQSCHVVSLDRKYLPGLVASGRFFQYSSLYTVLIAIFFVGGGGGGEAGCFLGGKLPSDTLDRTLLVVGLFFFFFTSYVLTL